MNLSRERLPAASRSVSQKLTKLQKPDEDPNARKRYLKQLLGKPGMSGSNLNDSLDQKAKKSKPELHVIKRDISPTPASQLATGRGSLALADHFMPAKLRLRKQEMEIVGRNLTSRDLTSRITPNTSSLDGSIDKIPPLQKKQTPKLEKLAKIPAETLKNSPSLSALLKPVTHRPSLQAVLRVGEEILNKSVDQSKDLPPKPSVLVHRKTGSGASVIEKIAEKICLQNKLITKPQYRGSLMVHKPALTATETGLIDISGVSQQDAPLLLARPESGLQQIAKRHSTLKQPFSGIAQRAAAHAAPVRSLQMSGDKLVNACPATAPAQVIKQVPAPNKSNQRVQNTPGHKNIQEVLASLGQKKPELSKNTPTRTQRHKRAASDIHESTSKLLHFAVCAEEKLEDLGTGRGGSLVRLKANAKNSARLILPGHTSLIPSGQELMKSEIPDKLQAGPENPQKPDTKAQLHNCNMKSSQKISAVTTLATDRTADTELCSWLLSDPLTSIISAWPRSAETGKIEALHKKTLPS